MILEQYTIENFILFYSILYWKTKKLLHIALEKNYYVRYHVYEIFPVINIKRKH